MSTTRDVAAFCEGEQATSICTPHGNVYLSKKCADSQVGLEYTAALVRAAVDSY